MEVGIKRDNDGILLKRMIEYGCVGRGCHSGGR